MVNNRKYEKMLADYDKHCIKIRKATTIKINEPSLEKQKRITKLQTAYVDWFEYYFPNYAKVACAPYHKKTAKILTENKQVYLLLEAFRSGGKTVHVTMGIPLYIYFVHQDEFYAIVMGLTEPKAKRLLSGIQAQLRSNQRLINDYGARFKMGDWADGDFITTDGARFRSFGMGQSPRGEQEEGTRPTYIAVDDSDSKKHINNDKLMQEQEDFLFEDLIGCFDAADNAVRRFVFTNNNFHKKSLTNRMKIRFQKAIQKAKDRGTKNSYHILTVPAVKNLSKFESNWPSKTSNDYWRNLYSDIGHRSFCREYMHIHVAEGAIFKSEQMQWSKMLSLSQYDGLVMYGDLSYKDQGDFKAMVLVGKKDRELHVIHSFLRQCSRKDVADWLYNLYEKRNLSKHNIKYEIDGLFAQDEFLSDFDIEGDQRGYHIPVVADKRPKGNKFDRIESLEGYFQRRWVFFNEQEKDHTDQIELLDQFYAFEKGSQAHDDGPDAVHGAVDLVNRLAFMERFEPRISTRSKTGKNRY